MRQVGGHNERLQILYLFKKFNDLKNFTAKMSAVTNLTQGMPKDIPSIKDAVEKLQILFAKDAPINLSRIYGKSSGTWQSKYLQIFEQIYKDLLQKAVPPPSSPSRASPPPRASPRNEPAYKAKNGMQCYPPGTQCTWPTSSYIPWLGKPECGCYDHMGNWNVCEEEKCN